MNNNIKTIRGLLCQGYLYSNAGNFPVYEYLRTLENRTGYWVVETGPVLQIREYYAVPV